MRCSAKKFAKCKLDSVGFVQSECYEITDPKRINRQKKALKLVESVAEISNITQAERSLMSAQEDDELIPIAPAAIAKLLKAKMDWSKLTVKEIHATCLVYLKTRVLKKKKALLVLEAEKLYDAAQVNMKAAFNTAACVGDDDSVPATNEPDEEESSDDEGSNNGEESSDDEGSNEEFSDLMFAVNDNVRVSWPNESAWFDGVVEKVCTVMLKIKYPDTDDWQHHDPTKWNIEKR